MKVDENGHEEKCVANCSSHFEDLHQKIHDVKEANNVVETDATNAWDYKKGVGYWNKDKFCKGLSSLVLKLN